MKHTTCWLALPSLSLSFLSLWEVREESVETVIISESLRPVWLPETPSLSVSPSCHSVGEWEWNEWMNAVRRSGSAEDWCGSWLSDTCHSAVTLTNQTDTPAPLHHPVHHPYPCLSCVKCVGPRMVACCEEADERISVLDAMVLCLSSQTNDPLSLVCARLSRELTFNSNPSYKYSKISCKCLLSVNQRVCS